MKLQITLDFYSYAYMDKIKKKDHLFKGYIG